MFAIGTLAFHLQQYQQMSSNKQNWEKLVGLRVLVTPTDESSKGPFEYAVKEVSPSGNKVKMENRAGRTFWCATSEYRVDEILK